MEETVERPDRFRKVKDLVQNVKTNATVKTVQSHVTENKATYLVGAIGVIAYVSKSRPVQIVNTVAPTFNNMPVINNTINNTGRLYKIVEDLETGEMTKRVAALATKIAEEHGAKHDAVLRMLSRHLNHPDLVPDVFGKTYSIAGTGTTG